MKKPIIKEIKEQFIKQIEIFQHELLNLLKIAKQHGERLYYTLKEDLVIVTASIVFLEQIGY